jgi:uncharacterized protein YbaR (Trm112 family)
MTSTSRADESSIVSAELLDLLVCPVDKQPVEAKGDELVCTSCGRTYPVEQGVPNMIVDEST